jgi:hypothetical protein
MNKYEYLSNTPLGEALKMYLAFLEARGTSYRTEEIDVQDALDRITPPARWTESRFAPCARSVRRRRRR